MTGPDGTAIVVFAKAPQPGTVKTRLIPLLGDEGAAALHAKLVKRTLETTRAASLSHVELHCAPDANDPFFQFCAGHYGMTTKTQVEGDLGERMWAVFKQTLTGYARVLLIGSDCPALAARHLRQAERALRDGNDAVFIPCEDGGYALIGLQREDRQLFEGMAWGGNGIMAATRARLASLGWRWHELETLWDVDRPEDYQRLVASSLLGSGKRSLATGSTCG